MEIGKFFKDSTEAQSPIIAESIEDLLEELRIRENITNDIGKTYSGAEVSLPIIDMTMKARKGYYDRDIDGVAFQADLQRITRALGIRKTAEKLLALEVVKRQQGL